MVLLKIQRGWSVNDILESDLDQDIPLRETADVTIALFPDSQAADILHQSSFAAVTEATDI